MKIVKGLLVFFCTFGVSGTFGFQEHLGFPGVSGVMCELNLTVYKDFEQLKLHCCCGKSN